MNRIIISLLLIMLISSVQAMEKQTSRKLSKEHKNTTLAEKPNLQSDVKATAKMYLTGCALRTFDELKKMDEAIQKKSEKTNVGNFGNKIKPNTIMVNVEIMCKDSTGLTGTEHEELWKRMPKWIPVSFLKKKTDYCYKFRVKEIVKEVIPVTITLTENKTYLTDKDMDETDTEVLEQRELTPKQLRMIYYLSSPDADPQKQNNNYSDERPIDPYIQLAVLEKEYSALQMKKLHSQK